MPNITKLGETFVINSKQYDFDDAVDCLIYEFGLDQNTAEETLLDM